MSANKNDGHTKCWQNVRQRIGQCPSGKRSFGRKISAWLNVKIKINKNKGWYLPVISKPPEEIYKTCQRYIIDEGRMFMGELCNEPLPQQQKNTALSIKEINHDY